VKTINRNRLNFTVEDDLRRALSTTQPRIDNLIKKRHMSKNHTEVYLAVCLVLLMPKLNKFDVLSQSPYFVCSYLYLNEDSE